MEFLNYYRMRKLILFFLVLSAGCGEDPIQRQPYPETLAGLYFMVDDSYFRDSFIHYHFASESEVVMVFQRSTLDDCEYTIHSSIIFKATYSYNQGTGKIDIFERRDPENARSFHIGTLKESERLPPLFLQDVYVNGSDWGTPSFRFLHINGCFSGIGIISLPRTDRTNIAISFSFNSEFDRNIPALVNNCTGGQETVFVDRIFSDSLKIDVADAYELLELAIKENGL